MVLVARQTSFLNHLPPIVAIGIYLQGYESENYTLRISALQRQDNNTIIQFSFLRPPWPEDGDIPGHRNRQISSHGCQKDLPFVLLPFLIATELLVSSLLKGRDAGNLCAASEIHTCIGRREHTLRTKNQVNNGLAAVRATVPSGKYGVWRLLDASAQMPVQMPTSPT